MPQDGTSKPESLEDALKVIEELTAKANETEKWKSLSRKNEERAKENAEAAKRADELDQRLKDIEGAKLTDAEKTAKRIEALENSLKTEQDARKASDLAALRARIGAEKQLPAALIDRLRGEDETSIAADADALLSVASSDGGFDIGQGQRGTAKPKLTDPLAIALANKVGVRT